ncbi:MAG: ATP-binding protein [Alphaproteobacteria bacterium]
MGAGFEHALRNELAEIPRLLEAVEDFCAREGVPPAMVFSVTLALDEIVTNVVSYGFDDGDAHVIRVSLSLGDGLLTTEVEDDGRPFDPLQRPDPDVSANLDDRTVGGLGIFLVKRMMDDVRYVRAEGRNHLVMVKHLAP